MDIYNPPDTVPYVLCQGGQKFEVRMYEIGVWNMDANSSKSVAHGLGSNFINIRNVQAFIRNDADTVFNPLNCFSAGVSQGGIENMNSTDITMFRLTGGTFDDINHNDAVMNRGWLLVWVQL